MKIPFDWIKIDNETYRAKVIGGWLVCISTLSINGNSESLVFVSDPEHKWEV